MCTVFTMPAVVVFWDTYSRATWMAFKFSFREMPLITIDLGITLAFLFYMVMIIYVIHQSVSYSKSKFGPVCLKCNTTILIAMLLAILFGLFEIHL